MVPGDVRPSESPGRLVGARERAARTGQLPGQRTRHRQLPTRHRSTVRREVSEMLTAQSRSEEHTSELQSPYDLVCRLLLEKKKKNKLKQKQWKKKKKRKAK